jgi:HEAT repeat associated with sister chromatid cohesion
MMEGDPHLMVEKSITRAVSRRLTDDQTSVREAALSLIGSYVTKSPAIASSFEAALLSCLKDDGVSVRKRCVKIYQDLLTVAPRFEGRSRAFGSLLERAVDRREEDGVRDMIHEFFFKLWLENVDDPPAAPGGAAAVVVVSRSGNRQNHCSAAVVAEQMVEVVSFAGDAEHLETLLRDLFRGAADNDKGKKQEEKNKRAERARRHCDRIVSSLIEQLLANEERRSPSKRLPAKSIAATLQSIGIFTTLAPHSVLRRVDVVFPYLKADNGVPPLDELMIVTASCEILYRLASTYGPDIASRAAHVSGDLEQVTYKFGSTAREAAIRTLSILSDQKTPSRDQFRASLFQLSHRFYKFLYKKSSDESFENVSGRDAFAVFDVCTCATHTISRPKCRGIFIALCPPLDTFASTGRAMQAKSIGRRSWQAKVPMSFPPRRYHGTISCLLATESCADI